MQNSRRLIISICLGGIVGVLLVRALFLDPVEELGWRMFWASIGNGAHMDFGIVVQSTTFAKCVAGLVLGSAAGFFITAILNRRLTGKPEPKITSTHGA